MNAIAHARTDPTRAPRDRPDIALAPLPRRWAAAPAEPTPLFTRHMLGAIEAERDRRRERRGRSGAARAARRRGSARAVHPRLTAASAGLTAGSAGSVRMQRPDLDRWTDDGGSMIVDSSPHRRSSQSTSPVTSTGVRSAPSTARRRPADRHHLGVPHYDHDYDLITDKTDLEFDSLPRFCRGFARNSVSARAPTGPSGPPGKRDRRCARCRCKPSWRGRRRDPVPGKTVWSQARKDRGEVVVWLGSASKGADHLAELAARGPTFSSVGDEWLDGVRRGRIGRRRGRGKPVLGDDDGEHAPPLAVHRPPGVRRPFARRAHRDGLAALDRPARSQERVPLEHRPARPARLAHPRLGGETPSGG